MNNQLQSTVRNGPLRRLHEKIVCDVAVDVVLEELEAQLDEDMEDLHEYETSLDDPRMLEHRWVGSDFYLSLWYRVVLLPQ